MSEQPSSTTAESYLRRSAHILHQPHWSRMRWMTRPIARHPVTFSLLAVALLFRVALIAHGWPGIDSDEAITGLVARHILVYGDHPLFFWGEYYLGSLQAYIAAPFFAAFGATVPALHLSDAVLSLGCLGVLYALGRAAYGPAVGLLVLGWLTFGPSIALLRELMAAGGYQDTLIFGGLVALGVWLRLRQPTALPAGREAWRRCLATYAIIGGAAGIGLWSDLLIVPTLVMALGVLALGRTRELASWAGLTLVLAFVLAAYPYLQYNATHQYISYQAAFTISHNDGHTQTGLATNAWLAQTGEMLTVAVPSLFGSPHVCVKRGDIGDAYPPAQATHATSAGGLCDDANLLFSLAILALYLAAAWGLARATSPPLAARLRQAHTRWAARPRHLAGWRALLLVARAALAPPSEPRTSEAAATSARHWLRALLLGIAALTLAAYSTSTAADRYQFTSARYLLPLYLSAPLVLGQLWHGAEPLVGALRRLRDGHRWRAPWRGRSLAVGSVAAAGALALLLALSVGGGALTLAQASDPHVFRPTERVVDQQLIGFLDANGLHTFYGDYWICYRLVFETGERLTCAVRGQYGAPNLGLINNRYEPYITMASADPRPAYILPAGSDEDADFEAEAATEHLPYTGYLRVQIGAYAVYYPPDCAAC